MRELQRTSQGESEEQTQPSTHQPAPGESKQSPMKKDGGTRVDPPQQSGTPAMTDSMEYLETSLTLQDRPVHHGGSAMASWGRSNDGLRQS